MTAFAPRPVSRFAALVLSLAALAGCATPPPADDPEAVAEYQEMNDPLEPMNRAIFSFNQAVDKALLKPIAEGYREVVPPYGRDRVRDFLYHWRSPFIFANDLLQGNVDQAVATAARFFFNSGFGLMGFLDVAGDGGIEYHNEDFGQTLAVWGVGEGPYLMLPILGPSTIRDTGGLVVEWVGDPVSYRFRELGKDGWGWTRTGVTALEKRERLLDPLDEVERGAIDYYSTLRSLYRQQRASDVRNGQGVANLDAPGGAPAARSGKKVY